MQRLIRDKFGWLLLLTVGVLVGYFYGLGQVPLIGPDEPRYAQVAREMFLRGDVVTPTLGGYPWFEKPALLYWLMMLNYRLFGVSEWSARFGSALAGFATVLIIGWLGNRIARFAPELRKLGETTALVLASSIGLLGFAHAASFDILVTMTITAALSCFLVQEMTPNVNRKRLLLAGFYLSVGFALLAKGLIGVVIPFGVLVLYFLLQRRWPERAVGVSLVWGALVSAGVAALWYWPVIALHRETFINEFFVQHHFARYVSNKYRHPQPFYFYVPVMLVMALPWTPFLIAALVPQQRHRDNSAASDNDNAGASDASFQRHTAASSQQVRLFALAWVVWPVLFFSAANSKLPGYVLPAVPGVALLIGTRLTPVLRGDIKATHSFRAIGGLLILIGAVGIAYAWQTNEVSFRSSLIIAVPLIATGLFTLIYGAGQRTAATCVRLVALTVFIAPLLVLNYGFENIAGRESVRGLLRQAEARGFASTPVFHLHTIERTAEFYAAGRIAYSSDGQPIKFEGVGQVIDAVSAAGGTGLVFVLSEHTNQLTELNSVNTQVIGDNGIVALVAVKLK